MIRTLLLLVLVALFGPFMFAASVRAQFTDEEKAIVGSGVAHLQKGELDLALTDLNEALRKNDKNYSAYFYRGFVRFLRQDLQGSIDDYSQVISLAPKAKNIEKAYNNRGNSYFFLKKEDKSLGDYDQAITINPNYVDPYVGRGNVLFNKGEFDKAFADYSKAIELEPKTTAAYVGRADVYFEKRELVKALDDLNTSLGQIENLAGGHLKRGAVYGLLGKWPLAIKDIARAADINSQSKTPYWGQVDSSLKDIDRFVLRNPTNAKAFAVRGIIFLFRGMNAESQKDLEESYRLDPPLRAELNDHLKSIERK